jgi:putative membrane protein
MAKMALVLLLSALHGALSGALRRGAATPAVVPGWIWRLAASLVVGVVAVIVWLVLLKPF